MAWSAGASQNWDSWDSHSLGLGEPARSLVPWKHSAAEWAGSLGLWEMTGGQSLECWPGMGWTGILVPQEPPCDMAAGRCWDMLGAWVLGGPPGAWWFGRRLGLPQSHEAAVASCHTFLQSNIV